MIYDYIELKPTTFMSNVGIHIPSHSIKSSIWSKGNVYLETIPKKTVAPISSEVIGTTSHHLK